MAWDDALLPEQKIAASHWGSSARVLAGPGTGKTHMLIHRIVYLIKNRNVDPKQILVITFTRAATNELKERLGKQLSLSENQLPHINTLHAFSLKILLLNREHSGIVQPLFVADDFEESHIIFPELADMINLSLEDVDKGYKNFQTAWNTLNIDHPELRDLKFREQFEISLNELRKFYGFNLRGELVYRLWLLLNEHPVIAEGLGYKHVLVDEYQDLNECDQQVIKVLEDFGANLFIVGDDDQSIYEFRNASPDGIIGFVNNRTSGTGDYRLTTCYRCPSEVISKAMRLIQLDDIRVKKEIRPKDLAIKGEIYTLEFNSNIDEAKGIAQICKTYIDSDELNPKDISILLSTSGLAKRIIEALDEVGIAWADLTPIWPFGGKKKKEDDQTGWVGREIYCVLRLLNNRQDSLALRTWLQLQDNIGRIAISKIREFCRSYEPGLSLWDGCLAVSSQPVLLPRHGNKIKNAFDRLTVELSNLEKQNSLNELLDFCIGSLESVSDPIRAEIRKFIDRIVYNNEITDLPGLIKSLQKFGISDIMQLETDAVRIITMHKSKGLSSRLVIIPGLEQQLMPGRFSKSTARRMLYVSVTRSSQILIMTHALERKAEQKHKGNVLDENARERSYFLREMDISRSGLAGRFVTNLRQSFALKQSERNKSVEEIIQQKRDRSEYDVFLCHNSIDKPKVKEIGEILIKEGILPWLDEWEIPPFVSWIDELQKMITQIKTVAVFVGPSGIGPWEDMEIKGALVTFVRRQTRMGLVLLPGCPDNPQVPLFMDLFNRVDFRKKDPEPVKQLIWGITGSRRN